MAAKSCLIFKGFLLITLSLMQGRVSAETGAFNTNPAPVNPFAYVFKPDTAGADINADQLYSDPGTMHLLTKAEERITAALAPVEWNLYDSLHLQELGLSEKVFAMGLKGMEKLREKGLLKNENIISIVDFSKPSVERRLYVIDLQKAVLLYHSLVAHGMKSGKTTPVYFSNKPSSNKSSLGFYVTSQTYRGSNGYSLRLTGCEKGFNDNAARRGIVVHGADYVREDYISSQGYIGRSRGCPALPPDLAKPLIDEIKGGTCFFVYYPSNYYLSKSGLLK